jgi:hypothetical protein
MATRRDVGIQPGGGMALNNRPSGNIGADITDVPGAAALILKKATADEASDNAYIINRYFPFQKVAAYEADNLPHTLLSYALPGGSKLYLIRAWIQFRDPRMAELATGMLKFAGTIIQFSPVLDFMKDWQTTHDPLYVAKTTGALELQIQRNANTDGYADYGEISAGFIARKEAL